MGLDPEDGNNPVIDQNEFTAVGDWIAAEEWSIAGGKAILNRVDAATNPMFQIDIGILIGTRYKIRFELLVADFINEPAEGIIVHIGGSNSGIYNTVGVHEVELLAISDFDSIHFTSNSDAIGDYAEIDWVTIESQGNFILDILEMNWLEPRKIEFFDGVATDHFQICANHTDATNCLVSFNI